MRSHLIWSHLNELDIPDSAEIHDTIDIFNEIYRANCYIEQLFHINEHLALLSTARKKLNGTQGAFYSSNLKSSLHKSVYLIDKITFLIQHGTNPKDFAHLVKLNGQVKLFAQNLKHFIQNTLKIY